MNAWMCVVNVLLPFRDVKQYIMRRMDDQGALHTMIDVSHGCRFEGIYGSHVPLIHQRGGKGTI
jgi:hypothetical protein